LLISTIDIYADNVCTVELIPPAPVTLPCDENVIIEYKFQVIFTDVNVSSTWFTYSVIDEDFIGHDLQGEKLFSMSAPGVFTGSFKIWCDNDCSEINGINGDSDENPSAIFILIETHTFSIDICKSATFNILCTNTSDTTT